MIRRLTRQRREFLYRKSLEGKEKAKYEQKRKVRKALEEGKPIPTELADDAADLDRQISAEDARTQELPSAIGFDSEYARAGREDPRIFITTSRDPSSRLTQFAKELLMVFPNSQKLNRGSHVVRELVDSCRENGATDLIFVHEHRGVPDGMIVTHLPFGPTAFFGLYNVVLRHDVAGADKSSVSTAYPHLVFDNFTTPLGERMMAILKYLFPVPKEDSHRVLTFANRDDFISFRHHNYSISHYSREEEQEQEQKEKEKEDEESTSEEKKKKREMKGKKVELVELGPRFDMKPYQILLGTVENDAADVEWTLHPFTNTAKQRRVL